MPIDSINTLYRTLRRIVPAPKKAHYIGSVRLGIAVARVVSVFLAVEGYACAPR
jgi:hypothetical protein